MLYEFLIKERDGILALYSDKFKRVSDSKDSNPEFDLAMPIFYDELIEVLRTDDAEKKNKEEGDSKTQHLHKESATRSGKESLRLGYTISQVVRSYGSLCQAITEHLVAHRENINAREFNRLNFCLDIAVSDAVAEFSREERHIAGQNEVQRIGYLAHEMRNALNHVAMAHTMIKKGVVGLAGSTNQVLENALVRMKDIIDRSLSVVRLQGEPTLELRSYRVIDLVSEVESTAVFEATDKSIQLHVEVPRDLIIESDHHLIISAISNLVQNAIKFNKINGNIWIRSHLNGDRVFIEVQDDGDGLPAGQIEDLFRPFCQKGEDRSGVGLGLSIARRAVELNNGHLTARDNSTKKGCTFIIDLPSSPGSAGDSSDSAKRSMH